MFFLKKKKKKKKKEEKRKKEKGKKKRFNTFQSFVVILGNFEVLKKKKLK